MKVEHIERLTKEQILIESPGRINLIGEHTDYNNGFVLPAAIDKRIRLSFQKSIAPNHCKVTALDKQDQFEFDLTTIQPIDGGWQNYVLGVVAALQKLTDKIQGFECTFGGNIPIGAGMSSSAALGCGIAMGLNELFALGLERSTLILAAQKAEHNFVGTLCGIMDQFASMMGKKNSAILLDCKTLDYHYFPLDLGNYSLLFLNSNVTHNLADTAYNTRRKECETGVQIIQKTHSEVLSLRDVTMEMLEAHKTAMPPIVFKRCAYVIEENQRVLDATKALEQKDFQRLGVLLYQSHNGLQYEYEVSCPELDYLVALTKEKPFVLGARMMGGGFGGCTINLIAQEQIEDFTAEAAKAYNTKFGIDLTPYIVALGDGTRVLLD